MGIWEDIRGKFIRPRVHERLTLNYDLDDIDESDAFDDDIVELFDICGQAIILQYVDCKGKNTQRLVTCKKIEDKAGTRYLVAFCHMRESLRTFRLDRVQDLFDPSSGECLGTPEVFFQGYLNNSRSNSAFGWGMSVRRKADFVAILNALVFVSRCDREYHPFERASIEKFITRFWLRMEIQGEPDCDDIIAYVDRLAPDAETFWVALHRIGESKDLIKLFKQSAREVVEADGRIAAEEFYWEAKIDEFFATS